MEEKGVRAANATAKGKSTTKKTTTSKSSTSTTKKTG
jgi:hypothetical protein